MRIITRVKMLITFISECEKKALKRTRRVLDTFANRIGNNVWQTPITMEGLEAVKNLLRQTASKNTAVSCHQLKSRIRTKLLWVVGKKEKFNNEGVVAVNWTNKDILKNYYENDWKYLPLIESLSVFSALLHDFGKASKLFQNKLTGKTKIKGSPLRHEWVSVLFLHALTSGKTDEEWLNEIIFGDIHNIFSKLKITDIIKPLEGLSPISSMLSWLILTHHKMPEINKYEDKEITLKELLSLISKNWGYQTTNEDDYKKYLKDCITYLELPSKSIEWQANIKKYAIKLKDNLSQFNSIYHNDSLRVIMLYSRLSLMLGDHYYSSLSKEKSKSWHSNLKLFANTDEHNNLKQQLDEHLVRVSEQTRKNVDKLPHFEGVFNSKIRVQNNKKLQEKSKNDFKWQDIAVNEIKKWRKTEKNIDNEQFGFFTVNMASTGKGKTFANAKIIQALSPDKLSLRYILALGLRTLTLQTGTEYKDKIGLTNKELAILIGSKAILNLYNKTEQSSKDTTINTGSKSSESLDNSELIYSDGLDIKGLDTVLRYNKHKHFLHAPVLVCTIDHIIQATEITSGGKYILPTLRLMSCDLVIDEVDDFDDDDLIAIGRLIHLAGMLGRKVMISSATIPPDLAQGYFNAYRRGWLIFAKMRDKNKNIGCAWIDEFKTNTSSISSEEEYLKNHEVFIKARIKSLSNEKVKRKVNIVQCDTSLENFPKHYFETIQNEIINKHNNYNFKDRETKKNISIGVVRIANVKPCIELTRFLLNSKLDNVEIKTMPYHSKQVLLMRHEQERYLDIILKRNKGNNHILEDDTIRKHIEQSKSDSIIFVLVVTPVEEVGRDHDFDWAIIEPSSYRSFIQLAGRVLRHREQVIDKPNISIMKYNYRTIQTRGEKVKNHHQFQFPGYQKHHDCLSTFNLEKLVDTSKLANRLDATNRIQKNDTSELASLEHKVIAKLLNSKEMGASTMQGWIDNPWWLSGIHQRYVKFRKNTLDEIQFLVLNLGFCKSDNNNNPVCQNHIKTYELSDMELSNIWFKRDYETLLKKQANGECLDKTALIYGEIILSNYGKPLESDQFNYNSQLGLYESKEPPM
jgi:CRISPR-associated endonuclease/helicase Cas3